MGWGLMQSHFSPQENFLEIISQHLPNVIPSSINHIQTGWTNIVISASDTKDSYIFRFPRNNFFSKMMLKDHSFCTFIKDKVRFKLPNLQIFYDHDRPFSMHQKIKGWSLTERFKSLSRQAITNVAFDIAQFLKDLAAIDPKSLPNSCNLYVSKFLDELSEVTEQPYDLSQHNLLRELEQDPYVVHGDLNPGNILLDENDRMIGIIDFAFAGISTDYCDISRIIGRSDATFEKPFINAYEETMGKKLDLKRVRSIIDIWNYVEVKYITYIRSHHPEIQLPS